MSKQGKESDSQLTGLVERVVEIRREMKQIPKPSSENGIQWKTGADPSVQKGVKILDKPRKRPNPSEP